MAAARHCCLDIRPGAHGPEVYLALVDEGTAAQEWCRVGADGLQHVATGQLLHAHVTYATTLNLDRPWEGNHSPLGLRDADGSAEQRWVYSQAGEEEFHGGRVLRHYRDGRGVEVHGWQFVGGTNMGCENAVHSSCDGCSYVFVPCQ